jgi:glycosyltransferase involved in cell wall biosynthesis
MAAGKPVIASSASSFPEIILDGQTGVLVPPRSAEDLARAILDLRNDPARRERLGQAGANRVMEYFQSHTMVSKTVALFEQVIRTHGSSMKHTRRLAPQSSK